MKNSIIVRVLAGGFLLACGAAYGQGNSVERPCPTPISPNSPNYGKGGDPCAFTYRVAQDRRPQLLRENPQCTLYGLAVVMCPTAVIGNFGQVRIGPGAPQPAALTPFVVPSTPPPLGVPAGQQAAADQLWQQASGLAERNRYLDAYPLLLKAANMGDKRAQATLGILYQDGKGVKADDRAAAYWNKAAAAQGHRGAQYALGGMYLEGEGGLPKDPAKATELLVKSANQGFDKAQLVMGFQYELGEGVPRDRQKAIALLRASGDGGWVADALADRRAPGRFANERALGDYLAGLQNAVFAASWAKARASLPSGGGGGSVLGQIMYGQWQRADPATRGGAPIH
jgi:hypothetical protein